MSYEYQYLQNFKSSSQETSGMGQAMDSELAKLRDKKGAFWTSLVEATAISKLATVQQTEQQIQITAMNVSKLITAVITDKYGESGVSDKLKELVDDAKVIIEAILAVVETKQ